MILFHCEVMIKFSNNYYYVRDILYGCEIGYGISKGFPQDNHSPLMRVH